MPWADTVVNALLDQLMRDDTPTFPTDFYFGLSTTDPLIDGSGVTEPSGVDAYARVQMTRDTTNFGLASSRTTLTEVDITFPTATGNWGLAGWVVIFDDPTAGNFMGYGDIPDQDILAGMTPSFPAFGLSFSMPST